MGFVNVGVWGPGKGPLPHYPPSLKAALEGILSNPGSHAHLCKIRSRTTLLSVKRWFPKIRLEIILRIMLYSETVLHGKRQYISSFFYSSHQSNFSKFAFTVRSCNISYSIQLNSSYAIIPSNVFNIHCKRADALKEHQFQTYFHPLISRLPALAKYVILFLFSNIDHCIKKKDVLSNLSFGAHMTTYTTVDA